MSIFLKKSILLRLAAIFTLAAIMAGTFAIHSSVALAKVNATCGTAISIGIATSATSGAPNCDVALSPNLPGQLTFTSDGAVAPTSGTVTVGDNPFTFTAVVTDERTGTTTGWRLQAKSAGLTGTSLPTLPLSITSGTATCGGVPCATTTFATPVDLNNSGTPLLVATDTSAAAATTTITLTGKYTVPVGAHPGAYTGVITLSLLDAAA